MQEKRTDVDFSKHDLIITKDDNVLIHHLKKPGTVIFNIKFINTNDVMVVTGDVGNWMFCREFHPTKNGYVSDDYWLEKLTINSTQDGQEFCPDETENIIREGIEQDLEEYGYKDEKLEQIKEYYNDLLDYIGLSEFEYTSYAYNNFPDFLCAEDVPFVKKIKQRLNIVYDAFNEICERLNFKDNTKVTFKDKLETATMSEGIIVKDKSFDGGYKIIEDNSSSKFSLSIVKLHKIHGNG